jgi:sortase A
MTAWGPRAIASGALIAALAAGCTGGGDEVASRDVTVASTTAATTTPRPTPTTTDTIAAAPARARRAAPTRITVARTTPATTTTAPPTTTLPPTTLPPTTLPPTTLPPTTLPAPTTVPAALPVPIAAPAEDGSSEPRVELGSIEIPAIGLQRTLQEGILLETLDRGPGHWPGTAMPGDVGNVVVAGHRVSHNEDFRDLDDLAPGDEVIFTTGAGRFTYRVDSTEIVPPSALWIVDQTPDHRATLFACHPPGSTRERIVVHLSLT